MIYLGYAKTGKEFDVTSEIEEMGIWVWCGRHIKWKRTGKKRYAEPYEEPALPNYVFIDLDARHFQMMQGVRFLARTLTALHPLEVTGKPDWTDAKGNRRKGWKGLNHLIDETRKRFEENDRLRKNAEVPVSEFTPGDILEIIRGPFADKIAEFRKVVEKSSEYHAKLETEIEGKTVLLDPLYVRKKA